MPRKKSVVPPVVIEKKPKVKYVSKLKEYAINFDATIKIHQGGFESALPWCIKVKEAIRLAILDKCPWVSEIISLDNIKFSQELIDNEANQKQESK